MRVGLIALAVLAAAACQAPAAAQQTREPTGQLPSSMDYGDPTTNLQVKRVAPGLKYVEGRNVTSNTIVVETSAGQVIIDTSGPRAARAHFDLLQKDGVTKPQYVILTHAHGDHTGGVQLWKGLGAKVVTNDQFPEFLSYTRMLGGFGAFRAAAQFQGNAAAGQQRQGQAAAGAGANALVPDIMFDKEMTLDVGDTKIQIFHTPGETPDHLTVWVPKLKAAFVGDNFYESFPNMYTLRGTRPRWALDYIHSLEKVMSLEPEIVIPSHGPAIVGKAEVQRQLKKMHDAIAYVHDAVLKGMNAGKDVHTLMQEIQLPKELDVGEGYGKISWSVRGIYEGYAGWFNGDPAEMFPQGRESVSGSVVALAGGPRKVADEAMRLLAAGKMVEALHMTSIGLEGAPGDKDIAKARAAAFEALIKASTNRNEQGWLQDGLAKAKEIAGK